MAESPRLIFDGLLENGWTGSLWTDDEGRRVFTLTKNDLMIHGRRNIWRHTHARLWRSGNWVNDFTSQRAIVAYMKEN